MDNLSKTTPLHTALINGQLELAQSLIEQAELINAQDESGETALFLAVEFEDVFEMLIGAEADVNISNELGETPLHEVAQNGSANQCKILLEHGANIHARDFRKQDPLHVASAHGKYEIVKLLIERGANLNNRDDKGKTPLHYAVFGNIMPHELNHNLLTAEALIQAGADLQVQTNDGESPLELAKRHTGYPELANLLMQYGAQ